MRPASPSYFPPARYGYESDSGTSWAPTWGPAPSLLPRGFPLSGAVGDPGGLWRHPLARPLSSRRFFILGGLNRYQSDESDDEFYQALHERGDNGTDERGRENNTIYSDLEGYEGPEDSDSESSSERSAEDLVSGDYDEYPSHNGTPKALSHPHDMPSHMDAPDPLSNTRARDGTDMHYDQGSLRGVVDDVACEFTPRGGSGRLNTGVSWFPYVMYPSLFRWSCCGATLDESRCCRELLPTCRLAAGASGLAVTNRVSPQPSPIPVVTMGSTRDGVDARARPRRDGDSRSVSSASQDESHTDNDDDDDDDDDTPGILADWPAVAAAVVDAAR